MIPPPLVQRLIGLTMLLWGLAGPLQAQAGHEDYDHVDPWVGFDSPGPGPDSAAVAGFVLALATSEPAVCQLAVRSIGNNWWGGDGDYPTGLLQAEGAQEAARRKLNRPVSEPRALALLAGSLGHQNSCVRRGASHMLGESQTPEAHQLLRTALRDPDARVREAAALGLACAEDPASFHDLTRALRDPEQPVVRMAAYALGEMEDARAVKPLRELLRARDAATRAAAANALGEIEDIRAAEHLTPLVEDDDPGVRVAAIEALGEIEDHRATRSLIKALRDKEVAPRRAAAEALGEVEDPGSAAALAQAMDDADPVVRRLAAQALGELDNLTRLPPDSPALSPIAMRSYASSPRIHWGRSETPPSFPPSARRTGATTRASAMRWFLPWRSWRTVEEMRCWSWRARTGTASSARRPRRR